MDIILIVLLCVVATISHFSSLNNIYFVSIQLCACITICLQIYGLKTDARTDKLTSLNNRGWFDYVLASRLRRNRCCKSIALMICDIDDFKIINDTYGHITGDDVLEKLADILKKSIRETDIACRYGGEEFAIVMADTSCSEADTVAKRILKSVEEHRFFRDINITISAGIAVTNHKVSANDIIKTADEALYLAKTEKNTVVCMQI